MGTGPEETTVSCIQRSIEKETVFFVKVRRPLSAIQPCPSAANANVSQGYSVFTRSFLPTSFEFLHQVKEFWRRHKASPLLNLVKCVVYSYTWIPLSIVEQTVLPCDSLETQLVRVLYLSSTITVVR